MYNVLGYIKYIIFNDSTYSSANNIFSDKWIYILLMVVGTSGFITIFNK